jgi:hypothetical protein
MPYDPTRAGIIGINRIIPFTAVEVGDGAAVGNVQHFMDARRKFRGNVATLTARGTLTGLQPGEWVLVEAAPTGPRIDMWDGTTWVTLTGVNPATTGPSITVATTSPHSAAASTVVACKSSQPQPFSVRLPAAAATGTQVVVKDAKGDADVNPVAVSTVDGTRIDGQTALVLAEAYGSRTFVFAGDEWLVI